jgi:hypothetical protein
MLIAVFTKAKLIQSRSPYRAYLILILSSQIPLPPGLPGGYFLQVPRSNHVGISLLGTLFSIVMAVCGGQDNGKF